MRICGKVNDLLTSIEIKYASYNGIKLKFVDVDNDAWVIHDISYDIAQRIIYGITSQGYYTIDDDISLEFAGSDLI